VTSARPRLARALGGVVVAGVVATLALPGCTDQLVHGFGAYEYDVSRHCLFDAAVVDVIDGPDPGECDDLRCWVSSDGEVYVTTTACDAPKNVVDHTKDPEGTDCYSALALFNKKGHSICPDPVDDGSS
jgi:hypothetical protein